MDEEAETCSSRRLTNVFLIYDFMYFVGDIIKQDISLGKKKSHYPNRHPMQYGENMKCSRLVLLGGDCFVFKSSIQVSQTGHTLLTYGHTRATL